MNETVGPRVFSIEEANGLVPELAKRVAEQLELGGTIQRLIAELNERTPPAGGHHADMIDITQRSEDSQELRRLKHHVGELVRRYREGWLFVEELGAVIKDPRDGLLDFYGRIDDRIVWLCWRHGETRIEHFHELDQGFSERKPLAPVRGRMLN